MLEIVLLSALLLALFFIGRSSASGTAELSYAIYHDQELLLRFKHKERAYGEFSLEELPGVIFSFNDSGLAIIANDCPDSYCLRQGRIKRPGEQIVCLPKHLLLRVETSAAEVDFITPVY
ncbi:MAG: NusG domain II-containing protein [Eubacteriales bacterium]|nr:NusG domain II-containing protein [Eubacteriales bacterium]